MIRFHFKGIECIYPSSPTIIKLFPPKHTVQMAPKGCSCRCSWDSTNTQASGHSPGDTGSFTITEKGILEYCEVAPHRHCCDQQQQSQAERAVLLSWVKRDPFVFSLAPPPLDRSLLEQKTQPPPNGVSLTSLEGAVVDLVLRYLAITQLRRRRQPCHTDVTRSHAREGQLRGSTRNWVKATSRSQQRLGQDLNTPLPAELAGGHYLVLALPSHWRHAVCPWGNQYPTAFQRLRASVGCLGREDGGLLSLNSLIRACCPYRIAP